MIDIKAVARDFVVSRFGVRESLFATAWDLISRRYEDISAAPLSAKDLRQLNRPLGIIGDEKQEVVLIIATLVEASRQVPVTGNLDDVITALKAAGQKWRIHERRMEALLAHAEKLILESRSPKEPRVTVKKNTYARMWSNETTAQGEPFSVKDKEAAAVNPRKYDFLIIKDQTSTLVFVNGQKSATPPGKRAYKILSYVLKNRGNGGSPWNIAQYVFAGEPLLERTRRERDEKNISVFSRRISRRIIDLNAYLKTIGLHSKLEADQLDEYKLAPLPGYCLIEQLSEDTTC